jgi:hypothetical protein
MAIREVGGLRGVRRGLICGSAIPRFEDEALGAVVAVVFDVVIFEDAEGFGGVVGAVGVGGVEDVAEFVAGEAVEGRGFFSVKMLKSMGAG